MWWEIKNHLEARNNKLFIHNKNTVDIAEKEGTPIYVYNLARVLEKYNKMDELFSEYSDRDYQIYYAIKANSNKKILKALSQKKAGADVTSPQEAELAVKSGFRKEHVLYTGTSVSDKDIYRVLNIGVRINIDSFSQLERLNKICNTDNIKKENLKISFRWNPGVGAGAHSQIITAGKESHGVPIKFGINKSRILRAYQKALNYGFKPSGLHQHIGSGWTGEDVKDFLSTVDKTLDITEEIERTLGYELEFVDFGGGPGIPYRENEEEFPIKEYVKGICDKVKNRNVNFKEIIVEPGRYLVGDAGILLCEVNTIKKSYNNLIVGVNTGFNHLIRPAFYGAYHEILDCNRISGGKGEVTIAGNLCETGDVLATKRKMTIPKEKEILAILNGGAYGYVMASRYNLRDLPKEIFV